MLQPELAGAAVADLYAGSGALGIEALSRGAGRAVFVEQARDALDALRDNLDLCGLAEHATVIDGDVDRALRTGRVQGPVDVALLDPPYDTDAGEVASVLDALVAVLAEGATVVVEADRHGPGPPWPDRLREDRQRRYGDTVLHLAGLAPVDRP